MGLSTKHLSVSLSVCLSCHCHPLSLSLSLSLKILHQQQIFFNSERVKWYRGTCRDCFCRWNVKICSPLSTDLDKCLSEGTLANRAAVAGIATRAPRAFLGRAKQRLAVLLQCEIPPWGVAFTFVRVSLQRLISHQLAPLRCTLTVGHVEILSPQDHTHTHTHTHTEKHTNTHPATQPHKHTPQHTQHWRVSK